MVCCGDKRGGRKEGRQGGRGRQRGRSAHQTNVLCWVRVPRRRPSTGSASWFSLSSMTQQFYVNDVLLSSSHEGVSILSFYYY
jgi:hypothetical protein